MTDTPPKKPLSEKSGRMEGLPSDGKLRHAAEPKPAVPETGGPKGPEPTRYGDWERKGRCIDF